MALACFLGIHKWNGCECTKCEKVRPHDWSSNCTQCANCGVTRDKNHDWSSDCEKCRNCDETRNNVHLWDGDRCQACGKIIDFVDLLTKLSSTTKIEQAKVIRELCCNSGASPWVSTVANYLDPLNDDDLRNGSAIALSVFADANTVDHLCGVLDVKQENPILLRNVANALCSIADQQAADTLMNWLVSLNAESERCGNSSRFQSMSIKGEQHILKEATHRDIIIALGVLKVSKAVPYLVEALQMPSFLVSDAAINALGELFPAAQSSLENIALNQTLIAERRIEAIEALGSSNDSNAISTLGILIKDDDTGVSMAAARALGQINVSESYEILVNILKDALEGENVLLGRGAASGLENFSDFGAVPHLCSALESNDELIRNNAAYSLANLGDRSGTELLMQMLSDKEKAGHAAEYLGKLQVQRAFQPLTDMLKSADEWDRSHAAMGLGWLGDKRAVPGLRHLLSDSEWNVVLSAAAGLAMLGDLKGFDILLHGLWLSGFSQHQQEVAIKALAQTGDECVVVHLVHALRGAEKKSRIVLVEAIIQLGTPAVDALLVELDDDRPIVRMHAADALGTIGDPQTMKKLAYITENDDNSLVRAAANTALKKIGRLKYHPPSPLVRNLISDNEPRFLEGLNTAVNMADGGKKEGVQAMREAIRILSGKPEVSFHEPGLVITHGFDRYMEAKPKITELARNQALLDDPAHSGDLISAAIFTSEGSDMRDLLNEIYTAGGTKQGYAFQLIYNELRCSTRLSQ